MSFSLKKRLKKTVKSAKKYSGAGKVAKFAKNNSAIRSATKISGLSQVVKLGRNNNVLNIAKLSALSGGLGASKAAIFAGKKSGVTTGVGRIGLKVINNPVLGALNTGLGVNQQLIYSTLSKTRAPAPEQEEDSLIAPPLEPKTSDVFKPAVIPSTRDNLPFGVQPIPKLNRRGGGGFSSIAMRAGDVGGFAAGDGGEPGSATKQGLGIAAIALAILNFVV